MARSRTTLLDRPASPADETIGAEGNHLWLYTLVHVTTGHELTVELFTETDRFSDVMGTLNRWRVEHKLVAYRYFEALEQ
jgi:hypothetical protein